MFSLLRRGHAGDGVAHADVDAESLAAIAALLGAGRTARLRCECRRVPSCLWPACAHAARSLTTSTLVSFPRLVRRAGDAAAMLGALGALPHGAAVNAALGRALLAGLADGDGECVAWCLRGLFTLYGDEDHDAEFAALGGAAALERALPALRAKVERDARGADGGVWGPTPEEAAAVAAAGLAEEVETLERFIAYKQSGGTA